MAAPLLVAVFAVPQLIAGMGTERFGLLAIIWMVIGYFSLFDLGLGRALTKLIAERLGREDTSDLRELIWTALWLILTLGVLGALITLAAADWLVARVLNVPEALHGDAESAMRILALGIPVVIVTIALVGILEAHQRFARIAAVRAPLGVLTFLGPLATVQFTPSLMAATAVLLMGRLLAMGTYFGLARALVPALKAPAFASRRLVRPLVSFGGWLSISNVVGPLMVYFDRFVIGAVLTLSAVSYYVTPYEILTRIWILPGAAMGVLFPALATAYVADRQRLASLFGQATRILLLVMLPPVTLAFLFAPEALEIWLGSDFRAISTPVARWLAVGVLINTIARVPFVALQGAGRPDLVAKLHLAELGPYFILLWLLMKGYGIVGAAVVWTLRIVIDAVVLLWLSGRVIDNLVGVVRRSLLLVPVSLLGFAVLFPLEGVMVRLVVAAVIVGMCTTLLWRQLRGRHAELGAHVLIEPGGADHM